MPTTDRIDAAFEASHNGLNHEERAAFRKGVEYAISIIQKYRADKSNYSHTNNPVIDAAIRTTCTNLEGDLRE